jgi:hypothetical protein
VKGLKVHGKFEIYFKVTWVYKGDSCTYSNFCVSNELPQTFRYASVFVHCCYIWEFNILLGEVLFVIFCRGSLGFVLDILLAISSVALIFSGLYWFSCWSVIYCFSWCF